MQVYTGIDWSENKHDIVSRLQPWHPDSLLTRQIRAKVSLCAHLTRNIVRTSNRLRAVLLR